MSVQRTMERSKLMKEVGKKNFSETWQIFQKEKYGDMYFKICKTKLNRNKKEEDKTDENVNSIQSVVGNLMSSLTK